MKALALAGLLMFPAAQSVSGPPTIDRIPVELRLIGDDGLTQKLVVALEKDLQASATLRPASEADRNIVFIESDSNVQWDELGGKSVIIYTVHVFPSYGRGVTRTGICYESGISKCVKEIARLARIAAMLP